MLLISGITPEIIPKENTDWLGLTGHTHISNLRSSLNLTILTQCGTSRPTTVHITDKVMHSATDHHEVQSDHLLVHAVPSLRIKFLSPLNWSSQLYWRHAPDRYPHMPDKEGLGLLPYVERPAHIWPIKGEFIVKPATLARFSKPGGRNYRIL